MDAVDEDEDPNALQNIMDEATIIAEQQMVALLGTWREICRYQWP